MNGSDAPIIGGLVPAIGPGLDELGARAAAFARSSRAPATERAYASDWRISRRGATEPELVDRGQHLDRIAGANVADLQIGPGRDIDRAAAETLGDIGQPSCLIRRHDAARQAQAEHERILVRRGVEEPVEFVAEDVETLGEAAGRRVGGHFVPLVERVLLAFRQLFRHQLAAGRDGAILRGNMERGDYPLPPTFPGAAQRARLRASRSPAISWLIVSLVSV
jgi:hypothetical protein